MPTKRYLITGATGFLGSYLVSQLLRRPRTELICLVRPSSACPIVRERVKGVLNETFSLTSRTMGTTAS